MKEALKPYLERKGFEVEDMGPSRFDPADDYPAFSFPLAQAVAEDHDSVGILLCRSGQGVCVVANKVRGVRASIAWNEAVARWGRKDDHINILCLPSDYISEDEAKKIVDGFLDEKPGTDPRYLRRLSEIKAIEENNS